ncbi:MAG: flagellar basal body-associated FliL family protein [Proteobacteria bacterium]|nr:flagellar basal body-associated FliL family protein [Pseudomonadota bacterium]
MADEPDSEPTETEDAEEGQEEDAAPPKKSGLKKIIIIAAIVVVLLGGGAGGAYFAGLLDPLFKDKGSRTAFLNLGAPELHQFPLLKADLRTDKCRSALLKAVMVVQLAGEDKKRLQSLELRVMDGVTQYLRDKERSELVGKENAEKLRSDITRIINTLMAPSTIQAVFFKEFILQ